MAPKISELLSDPDYKALTPEEQFDVRRSYFQQHVGADPDFQALPETDRQQIGKSILFPEAKKEESFFGKLKSGQAFEGKAGAVVESGLNVLRQLGGAPEKTFENVAATFNTERESQRLKETFGKFVGEKTAEPLAKGITAARAAGGALFGPIEGFIPRVLVEKGGEIASAAGKGLAAGARKLGLPEVIPAVIEEFTPDALFLAVGARLHGVTDLNAPLDRAFAKIEGRAPATTNDIARLAQDKPQEYAKAFGEEIAAETPAAGSRSVNQKFTAETPIADLVKRAFPETERAPRTPEEAAREAATLEAGKRFLAETAGRPAAERPIESMLPRETPAEVSRETFRPKVGESGTQIETGAARPVESILPAAGKLAKWESDIVKAGVIGADKLAELKAEAAKNAGEGVSFDEVYQKGIEQIAKTARKRTAASAKEAGDLLANFAIDPTKAAGIERAKAVRLKRATAGDMRDMLDAITVETDPGNLFAIAQSVENRTVRNAAANRLHDDIPAATQYVSTLTDPALLSQIGQSGLYDSAIRSLATARAKSLSESAKIVPGSTIEPAAGAQAIVQTETPAAVKSAQTAPGIEGVPAAKPPTLIPEAEPRRFRDRVFQETPEGQQIRPAVKFADIKGALAESLREYGNAPEGMEAAALAEIDQLRRSLGQETPAPFTEGAPAGPKLTKYDTPEIIRARAEQAQMTDTATIDTPERWNLRDDIAAKLIANGGEAHGKPFEPERGRRIDVILGAPGAGKSSLFVEPLRRAFKSLIIDADEAKKLLDENQAGKAAGAVHRESALIADSLMLEAATTAGYNIIYPVVGKNPAKFSKLLSELKAEGYDVNIHLVEISPEESALRSVGRYYDSNRFVDPDYAQNKVGLKPRETYERMKAEGVSSYDAYSNEVAYGEPSRLLERSESTFDEANPGGARQTPAARQPGYGRDASRLRAGGPQESAREAQAREERPRPEGRQASVAGELPEEPPFDIPTEKPPIKAGAEKPIGDLFEKSVADLSTKELLKKSFTETGTVGALSKEQTGREVAARDARRELYLRITREAELAKESFDQAAVRVGLAAKQIQALKEEQAGELKGKFPLSRLEEERGAPVSEKQFDNIPDPFKGSRLNTATTEAITRTAAEFYKENGLTLDKDIPISLQIARDLAEKKLPVDGLRAALAKEGVTLRELADGFLGTATNAGRQLNQLAQVQKKLLRVLEDAKDVTGAGELLDSIKGPPPSAWEYAGSLFTRWLNIWKGLLVSQLSTTVRNLETQGARVGVEAIEKLADTAVRKIFNVGTEAERTFGEASERAIEILKDVASSKRRALADKILEEFPEQKDRLFHQYTADVERATPTDARGLKLIGKKIEQITSGAERVTELANTLNSMQEYLFRRAGFRAKLAEELRAKGQDIERIDPKAIDEAMIERAVDHGLHLTFAETPKGGLGGAIMGVFRAAPLLGLIAPFPRFMINSWRTFLDFSPAAFLKLLSPTERAKIAQGDVKTVSRAIIGTGLLGSALAIRDSENAGEKWYEIQAGGKTYDARPFNPFATYLFVADLMLKSQRGELQQLKFKDLTQGLFSANFRAGTGLFMLDKVGDVIGGLFANEPGESSAKALKEATGQFLAGFLTPLQTLTDIVSDERLMSLFGAEDFAKEEAKVRETRTEPLLGPSKARIPGLSQTLPEKEYPLGPENAEREEPILKQFTGLLQRTKTAAQKEGDRLGLTLLDLQRPVGIPEFDRLVAEKVRPKAEEKLSKIIESESYSERGDLEKRIQFKQVMGKLVGSAKRAVLAEHPEFREDVKIKEAGGDKGRLLKKRFEELKARRGEAE
jgi:hypothetical protein